MLSRPRSARSAFSLLELVVVVVVLAVLASLAIPTYGQVVRRSARSVAEVNLGSFARSTLAAEVLRRSEVFTPVSSPRTGASPLEKVATELNRTLVTAPARTPDEVSYVIGVDGAGRASLSLAAVSAQGDCVYASAVFSQVSTSSEATSADDLASRGCVPQGATGSGSTPTTPTTPGPGPSTPTERPVVTVRSISDTGANLTWTTVSGTTTYDVQVAADEAMTSPLVTRVSGTTFVLSGQVPGSTAWIRVVPVRNSATLASSVVSALFIPAAPQDLKAALDPSFKPSLSWSPSAGAASHEVYRAVSNGFVLVQSLGPTASAWVDAAASSGPSEYLVRARNASGVSASSNRASVVAPVAPELVLSEVGSTTLRATWTPSPGVIGYSVRTSLDPSMMNSSERAAVGPEVTSVLLEGLPAGDTLYVSVTAVVSPGVGPASVPVLATLIPAAPSSLVGDLDEQLRPVLTWNATNGATSYQVHRDGVLAATTTDPTWTDRSTTAGTTYVYTVKATNAAGTSAASAATSVLVPGTTTVTLTGSTASSLTASWTQALGATGYLVEYSSDPGFTDLRTASASSTSTTITGLAPGRTYYLRVVPLVGTRPGPTSNTVSRVTIPAAPAPTVRYSTANGFVPEVSWSLVSGASAYDVYRDGVLVQAGLTGTGYVDTTTTSGTRTYGVIARNTSGWSARGEVTTTVPRAPVLAAGSTTATTATLSWTSTSEASSYLVRYSTSAAMTSPTSVVVAGTTTTVTGLSSSTDYYFDVVPQASGTAVARNSNVVTTSTVPAAPTGLVGSLDPNSFKPRLNWTAVPNATGYQIRRDGVVVGTSPTPSYYDTFAAAGATYSYSVLATNSKGTSAASSSVTVVVSTAPVLTLVATGTTVTATWTASYAATGYSIDIQHQLDTAVSTIETSTTTAGTRTATWTRPAGSTVAVAVSATGVVAPRSNVATVTLIPSTPARPALASFDSAYRPVITWPSVPGTVSYSLYRDGVLAANLSSPSFTDTATAAGTSHTYYVEARNIGGTSAASQSASIYTPAAVTITSIRGSSPTSVDATWTTTPGATAYHTRFSTTPDMANVVRTGAWYGSPATTAGFAAGTTYYAQVRPSYATATGEDFGPWSASAQTVTLPAAPVATGSLGADNKPCVSWTAVTGATSYAVLRKGPNDGTTFWQKTTMASGSSWCDPDPDHGAGVYSYYVFASNASGGTGSNVVAVTVPVLVPAAPATTTAALELGSTRKVVVSWTSPPSNGGAPVTSYLVTLKVAGTGTVVAGPTTVAANYGGLVFNEQKAGVNYVGEVSAVNSAGAGPTRTSSALRVIGDVPSAVPFFTPSALTSTKATLSWSAPAATDAQTPVSSYRLRVVDVESGTEVLVFDGNVGLATSRNFTGLATGNRHLAYLWPINEAGTGLSVVREFRPLSTVEFTLVGGGGGSTSYNGVTRAGGASTLVQGVLRARSGQVLYLGAGGAGGPGSSAAASPGGVISNAITTFRGGAGSYYGAGGGSASVLGTTANLSSYLAVAGGGGGSSRLYVGGVAGVASEVAAGNGGGTNTFSQQGKGASSTSGAGGTATTGGSSGSAGSGTSGGAGGACSFFSSLDCGGGGGGGRYGGGGGATQASVPGGGGGGSSYHVPGTGSDYAVMVYTGPGAAAGVAGYVKLTVDGVVVPTITPGSVVQYVVP